MPGNRTDMAIILHKPDRSNATYTRSSNESNLNKKNVCLYHFCFSIAPLDLGCCSSWLKFCPPQAAEKSLVGMGKRCGYDPASLASMGYLSSFGKIIYFNNLYYTVVKKLILNCAERAG